MCRINKLEWVREKTTIECQNFAKNMAYIESVKETWPIFVVTKEHAKYLLVGVKSQKSNMNEQVRQSFSFEVRILCSFHVDCIGNEQQSEVKRGKNTATNR